MFGDLKGLFLWWKITSLATPLLAVVLKEKHNITQESVYYPKVNIADLLLYSQHLCLHGGT